MNMDHVRGTALLITGRVQKVFGLLVRSSRQRRRGVSRELQGQVRRCLGDASELFSRGRTRAGSSPE
jgi:uncharacterized protein YjbJ (UPF0337 family)